MYIPITVVYYKIHRAEYCGRWYNNAVYFIVREWVDMP